MCKANTRYCVAIARLARMRVACCNIALVASLFWLITPSAMTYICATSDKSASQQRKKEISINSLSWFKCNVWIFSLLLFVSPSFRALAIRRRRRCCCHYPSTTVCVQAWFNEISKIDETLLCFALYFSFFPRKHIAFILAHMNWRWVHAFALRMSMGFWNFVANHHCH